MGCHTLELVREAMVAHRRSRLVSRADLCQDEPVSLGRVRRQLTSAQAVRVIVTLSAILTLRNGGRDARFQDEGFRSLRQA